ncbi:hypothetical protein [Chitinophaga sp. YIM B06452]|uniref:hypothetical protein n=1 Tax=Chitinophaga sp. YIM B06452 TaxID=3082158 RepID=UPI0031FE8699
MAEKTTTTAKLSNEELLKKEKILKVCIYGIITGCLITLAAGIYLSITKGKFNALLVTPFSLAVFPALIANSLKEIRKEKKARNI